jgi:chromosome partitioning protein
MPYLDIIPANINLVGAEVELVSLESRETRLKNTLRTVADDYEYVFIDSPPSLGLLTLNALTAADSVIVPVQCEYFALEGLGQLLNTINIVRSKLNTSLKIEGVLLTMFDTRLRLSHQVREEVRKYFGEKVFDTVIGRNVRIAESPSHAKPVILYDSMSTGAKNYMRLAAELINKSNNKSQKRKA